MEILHKVLHQHQITIFLHTCWTFAALLKYYFIADLPPRETMLKHCYMSTCTVCGLYTVATTVTSTEPLEFTGTNVGQPKHEKGHVLTILNRSEQNRDL